MTSYIVARQSRHANFEVGPRNPGLASLTKTLRQKIALPKRKIDEGLGIDYAPMLIPEVF